MSYQNKGSNKLSETFIFESIKPISENQFLSELSKVLLGVFLCVTFVSRLYAQNTDSSAVKLLRALKKNSYPVQLVDGKLQGEGGIWLRKHAEKASVVALGEQHATREIPSLMSALISDLKENDEFDHLALEASPWTVNLMKDSLQKGEDAYDSLIKKYPAAIPFYNFQNERDLVHRAVISSNSKRPLWGLDQVFEYSTQMAFDRLKELAESNDALSAVQKVEASADSSLALSPKSQDLSPVMPNPITFYSREDIHSLKNHFKENDEALEILSELSKSIKIYRTYHRDNYASNQLRARYLRDNLRNDFKQAKRAEDSPKVVIKMGAAHIYKGFTPNNALDVGNLSVSLAQSMGGKSLNVAILCGPGGKSMGFPHNVHNCYRKAFGKAFESIVGDQITLIDLIALHPMLHKREIDPGSSRIKRFLWAFDAVILVPDTHPARYITPIAK